MKLIDRALIVDEQWDFCVEQDVASRIYGYTWFLDALKVDWKGIVWEENGVYIAVMPIPIRSKAFVKYVYPPFFIQQLGVFSSKKNSDNLILEALKFLKTEFSFIEYYSKSVIQGAQSRNNLILHLNCDYSELYKSYSDNHKRNLKKVANLEFKTSNNYAPILEIFKQNKGAELDHLSKMDYSNLSNLCNIALEKGVLKVAEVWLNKQLICGGLFFIDQKRVTFLFSGTNEMGKSNYALFYLMDRFIEMHCNEFEVLDFEGSQNPGLYRFYKGFGSELEMYSYIEINNLKQPFKWLKKIRK